MSAEVFDASEFARPADNFTFNKPALEDVQAALAEAPTERNQAVSPTLVYGLSDLDPREWQRIERAWRRLPAAARHHILRALHESSEALFELSYRELALRSLADETAMVREAAIELLWTDDSEETMQKVIDRARHDPAAAVQVAAVRALGRFILLGEYGDVSQDLADEAQRLTYDLHTDDKQPLEMRRRALESLANSSHAEAPDLIRKAYSDGNHELKISAIFAMGRTCSRDWAHILLEELHSPDDEAIYEAIVACGQIQLEASVPLIGELALSDDREIQQSAIWALGEIGGRQAFGILSRLDELAEDDETAALLEEALAAAGMGRGLASLDSRLNEF